jgi:NADPH:quinone reductase-like Zn-dependent oxidoreductase
MKAMLLINHGGPELLRYGEAADPTAGPGEVVVDIHAVSVNAADYKVRLGGGDTALVGSRIFLVGTSPAPLARLERGLPISASGTPYSG